MRKIALAVMLILALFLSSCTAFSVYKERGASTGTIIVKTIPSGLDVTIERAGNLIAEGASPLAFDGAEKDRNYLITATNEDGQSISETRSISKAGGSVTVTLNFNEVDFEAQ